MIEAELGARVHNATEAEIPTLNVYIKFLRAADSVAARIHRDLSFERLSITQYGALEALHHLGPLWQRELATKLLKSARNITMVVDNLERRGLVRRERDSADRRYTYVHLTEEGRRVFERIFPSVKARIMEEMGILSEAEQQQLGEFCLRLGKRLEKEGRTA